MKTLVSLFLLALLPLFTFAQEAFQTVENLPYSTLTNSYAKERCKLDVYAPKEAKGCPVIVWFHGGGLEGGEKYVPNELKNQGVIVVAVNYRLSPKALHPDYLIDAAEAIRWTCNNIAQYGGDKHKIYVSGHSAGGYLTLMMALDKHYLKDCGIDADSIAGYFPISGQTATHYTIRKEMNLPFGIPFVDVYAPLNHVDKATAPLQLITGDRNLEMASRYEENLYLQSALKAAGNTRTFLYELQGFDHGTVVGPACLLMLNQIKKR